MTDSIVQLARSRADDDTLGERVGGDGQRFLVLCQRLLWGADQPDLLRVDVPATAAAITTEFPDSAAAHMLAAYGLRDHDRAAADRALARARELAGPDHPDAYLVPDDAEWGGRHPEQTLQTLVPDRIWRATSYAAVTDSELPRENAATIVRTADSSLVIINPVELTDAIHAEVAGLGEVRALVVQGPAHSRGIVTGKRQFPGARTYGTRAHGDHPPARDLRFDHLLDDGSPHAELRVLPIAGAILQEQVLLHEPTAVLISQDVIQANFRSLGRPVANALYSFGFGLEDRIGLHGFVLPLITNLPALQRSLSAIGEAAPRAVVGAHFGLLRDDELDGLGKTVRWIAGLGAGQHRRLLLRYFANQPAFLRDIIRYKVNQALGR